jgi:hypothetical protein
MLKFAKKFFRSHFVTSLSPRHHHRNFHLRR